MPKIDQDRLRKYFADAESAHASLMRAWENVRTLRREAQDAELALQRTVDGARHIEPEKRAESADPRPDTVQAAKKALKIALDRVARAEAARESLEDRWHHASRLKTSVANYARAHDALPADLLEI
ncbi:hypothetical protein RMR21_004350 [Agrobacterium sp. rho-8.1]|nr:hypothetical protein [Agrobacterium sp. rho-8.1]